MKRQTLQWSNEKTDTTMIKWKGRHYNDQMKRQALQWSNEKTDTTMIKWKDTLQWSNEDRHNNDQMKRL
jgi:hypothetical protein